MNDRQKQAYEWAKSQCYQSVAAQYAKVLVEVIDELQEQLAESQSREQAAVELIGKLEDVLLTTLGATEYVKPNTGIWHTICIGLDWIGNWRGQQEAGEKG